MWPTLLTFGGTSASLPVHSWGVMITLAFLAAAGLVQLRAPRAGVEGDGLVGFYLVAILSGLVGARLLHFLMAEPARFLSDPLVFFRPWEGGFAFYGGAILATVTGVAWLRFRRLPVWATADLVSPLLMLALSIGRIGCFLAGCCHGAPASLPDDAINLLPQGFSGGALYVMAQPPFLLEEFHHGVGLNDTPMLPTQLWESAGAFGLFLLLSLAWTRRRYDGQVFGWLCVTYPLLRSTIEAFRGDTIRGVDWFGLFSTSQLVSIPVLLLGLVVLLWRRGHGLTPPLSRDVDRELAEELANENLR